MQGPRVTGPRPRCTPLRFVGLMEHAFFLGLSFPVFLPVGRRRRPTSFPRASVCRPLLRLAALLLPRSFLPHSLPLPRPQTRVRTRAWTWASALSWLSGPELRLNEILNRCCTILMTCVVGTKTILSPVHKTVLFFRTVLPRVAALDLACQHAPCPREQH